ncbi:MAG: hypothetical protein Alpg2KO_03840 [Alphaproteobacteria bacterium]
MEEGFLKHMLVGSAMLLVVEGLLYAAFPAQMKQMMSLVVQLPTRTLTMAGIGATALGLALYYSILLVS